MKNSQTANFYEISWRKRKNLTTAYDAIKANGFPKGCKTGDIASDKRGNQKSRRNTPREDCGCGRSSHGFRKHMDHQFTFGALRTLMWTLKQKWQCRRLRETQNFTSKYRKREQLDQSPWTGVQGGITMPSSFHHQLQDGLRDTIDLSETLKLGVGIVLMWLYRDSNVVSESSTVACGARAPRGRTEFQTAFLWISSFHIFESLSDLISASGRPLRHSSVRMWPDLESLAGRSVGPVGMPHLESSLVQ